MKKILLFLLAIITLISSPTTIAQFKLGIIGGINSAVINVEDGEVSSRTLWDVGAVANYELSDQFSIQTELLYLKKGGIREEDINNPKIKLDQSFLEIPLMLKYSIGNENRVFLLAGPTFGFILSSEIDAETEGIVFTADMKDVTENFDVGISAGGGFSFKIYPGTLILQGKYTFGLTNLAKDGKFKAQAGPLEIEGDFDSEENKYKTRSLQISVGFMIPI